MKNTEIVLASGSPRRKELLEQLGYEVVVKKIEIEEVYPKSLETKKIAEYIAGLKMDAFLAQNQFFNQLVVTADTIVVKDKKVLGKPKNREEAFDYLMCLSNSKHEVITGVCISNGRYKKYFSDISAVYFEEFTPDEIKYYIDNYEVFDKAGGYAIQEWIGLAKIYKIVGSYTNIVGLPTQKVYKNLKEFFEKIN